MLLKMEALIQADIAENRPLDWRIVYLGDYVDRGSCSSDAIEFLANHLWDERRIALAGNHDVGFVQFLESPNTGDVFATGGGEETARSYGVEMPFGSYESFERLQDDHERLLSAIPKAWACSVKEINWLALGYEGSKFGYLVGQSGLFHNGHRATDDCYALLEVLTRRSNKANSLPFAELLQTSKRSKVRIFAENAPFDMKYHLKARGYRWSDGSGGRPKAWWIEVDDQAYDEELTYLRTDIYSWKEAQPLTIFLTAHDRFRG